MAGRSDGPRIPEGFAPKRLTETTIAASAKDFTSFSARFCPTLSNLETEVSADARLHFLGSPEWHPYQVDLDLLDAGQRHHFLLGVRHQFRTGRTRRGRQRHVDLHRRPVHNDVVDESEIHDVQLQIRILHSA